MTGDGLPQPPMDLDPSLKLGRRLADDLAQHERPGQRPGLLPKGGAEGTRTPDPHTASVVRYQLRHGPKAHPVSRALAQYYTCTTPGASSGWVVS